MFSKQNTSNNNGGNKKYLMLAVGAVAALIGGSAPVNANIQLIDIAQDEYLMNYNNDIYDVDLSEELQIQDMGEAEVQE